MYLDARHFGADMWEHRFPTILAACRAHGIDPVTEPIPVAPAAHYASGGVRTDLRGRTTVPGLYACGEVACTGVHGANRLASNSLLEGLVFAERIAADITRAAPEPTAATRAYRHPVPYAETPGAPAARPRGPLRDPADHDRGRRRAALRRPRLAPRPRPSRACTPTARDAVDARRQDRRARRRDLGGHQPPVVARSWSPPPAAREETRGCHWREDHPERDDAAWRRHLVVRLNPTARWPYTPPTPQTSPDPASQP